MQDITTYSDQELSLIVNNDESLYIAFQNSTNFEDFITQYIEGVYIYTEEQLEELKEDFYDQKKHIQEILEITKGDPLKEHVAQWVIEKGNDYQDIKSVFKDLMHGGCASGLVTHLIYYKDTSNFYNKFEYEIWKLLEIQAEIHGYKNPLELISSFKGAKEIYDLTRFKNTLSWYAFEQTAYDIATQIRVL